MFRMNEQSEVTGEVLAEFIAQHEQKKTKWQELENQYMSKPPIITEEAKDDGKPDNRLAANFGRYLVLNFNGYFIGVPTQVAHENEQVNEAIQTFWRNNDMDDVLDELGKLTSIYGQAYLFMYQDEDSQTRVAYAKPYQLFNIYSDHIKPSTLYTVKYGATEDGYAGQIYDDSGWIDFTLEDEDLTTYEPEDGGQLFYGRPPAIEFVENEERQSLIEPVETLINNFNNTLSEKANDISYFADAYLLILGMEVAKGSEAEMRRNKLINAWGEGSEKIVAKFLEKPNADQSQENQLDRLERLIYTLSMVTNTSENQVGVGNSGTASGEALKVKQQSMMNMAMSKERKFESGLQTMFRMFFGLITNVPATLADEYLNIEYNWTRNVVNNITEEVDNVTKLQGVVSHRKQLELLSEVNDVEVELKRIEEENEAPPMYDFEKGE